MYMLIQDIKLMVVKVIMSLNVLQEALGLPDNTVCYIDDISIPHSWYTIEYFNNKLYIQRTYGGFRIDGTAISIPIGITTL